MKRRLAKACAPGIGAHKRVRLGHNGGPALEPFGLRAAWLGQASEAELRRLAILHLRIERRKASLNEMVAERTEIMRRCIRRMRRAQGKN